MDMCRYPLGHVASLPGAHGGVQPANKLQRRMREAWRATSATPLRPSLCHGSPVRAAAGTPHAAHIHLHMKTLPHAHTYVYTCTCTRMCMYAKRWVHLHRHGQRQSCAREEDPQSNKRPRPSELLFHARRAHKPLTSETWASHTRRKSCQSRAHKCSRARLKRSTASTTTWRQLREAASCRGPRR